MSNRRPRTGTVVVRAWVEQDSPATDIRARVLVIKGARAETDEIGVAAGLDEVLTMISDALESIVDPPA